MNNDVTKFFYNLTPEVILNTVEKLGTRCTGKIVPLNSLENRVYNVELEVSNPEALSSSYEAYRVVKFYRPGRWSKEQILEEHRFIEELEERDLPVVPALKFEDGSTLHTIYDFDGSGTELYAAIFPRVGGRLMDELSDQQVSLLGHMIARLHQVGRAKPSQHRMILSPATFGRNSCDYLSQNNFLPPEISKRYQELVVQICQTCEPWFEGVPMHRIHGDLHHGNILWVNETFKLVDFDDFVMGPAIQDLWLLISGREGWQKDQRDLLIDAYAEVCEFDFESMRLIEPLRALRMINFSAWIARRWDDPSFKHAFANFGRPDYWREHLISLEECYQIMQCGEGFNR